MERFVYPPYGVYQGYGGTLTTSHSGAPRPPSKQPSWKQSKSSNSTLNPYRGVSSVPSSTSPDYLDTYKRAQLKALLSQVSPGLTPRLRKTNTKEVGVQVNPRVDAAVQCSLGPRPLQAVRPQSSPAGRLRREQQPLPGVYSPIPARRLFTLPEAVVEPPEQDEAPPARPQLAEEPGEKAAQFSGKGEEEQEKAAAEGQEPPESRDEEPGQLQDEAAGKGSGLGEGKRTTFQVSHVVQRLPPSAGVGSLQPRRFGPRRQTRAL